MPTTHPVLSKIPGLLIAAAIAAVATVIGLAVPILGSAVPAIVIGVVFAVVRKPGA